MTGGRQERETEYHPHRCGNFRQTGAFQATGRSELRSGYPLPQQQHVVAIQRRCHGVRYGANLVSLLAAQVACSDDRGRASRQDSCLEAANKTTRSAISSRILLAQNFKGFSGDAHSPGHASLFQRHIVTRVVQGQASYVSVPNTFSSLAKETESSAGSKLDSRRVILPGEKCLAVVQRPDQTAPILPKGGTVS